MNAPETDREHLDAGRTDALGVRTIRLEHGGSLPLFLRDFEETEAENFTAAAAGLKE